MPNFTKHSTTKHEQIVEVMHVIKNEYCTHVYIHMKAHRNQRKPMLCRRYRSYINDLMSIHNIFSFDNSVQ